MADDMRQRFAEALAAKFTEPIYHSDLFGENEWVENPNPSDRVGQSLMAHFIAGDGHPSFRALTCMEAAEVCAQVRDEEMERLRAAFDRIDSAHQPKVIQRWVSCPDHPRVQHRGQCHSCVTEPGLVCSNLDIDSCQGLWPCEWHTTLYGEEWDACTHKEATRD